MARLESRAKGGYYPTPPMAAKEIESRLTVIRNHRRGKTMIRALDPCSGTGEALNTVTGSWRQYMNIGRVETYGIELNQERAKESAQALDHVLNADLFGCNVAHDIFNLIYLNPPYDTEQEADGDTKRSEYNFLQRCTPYLIGDQGILVLVIPLVAVAKVARHLAACYTSIGCYNFPEGERELFSQVYIIARRRRQIWQDPETEREIRDWARALEAGDTGRRKDYKLINQNTLHNISQSVDTGDKVTFNSYWLNPHDLVIESAEKGLWSSALTRQAFWPADTEHRRPLMPLRDGHIGMLAAAGMLNSMILPTEDGRRLILKGKTQKKMKLKSTDETKTVQREQMETTLTALDLDTGEIQVMSA